MERLKVGAGETAKTEGHNAALTGGEAVPVESTVMHRINDDA